MELGKHFDRNNSYVCVISTFFWDVTPFRLLDISRRCRQTSVNVYHITRHKIPRKQNSTSSPLRESQIHFDSFIFSFYLIGKENSNLFQCFEGCIFISAYIKLKTLKIKSRILSSMKYYEELSAAGIRCADHATPSIRKKLALTTPTSGGRSVGIVRLRTKGHGVQQY
jgi:hypothetical protein